ncbi:hypothetical protein C2G38_2033074 [Gigaspora rosea]|uniref:Peptidase S1 domain-containing protein n=1 Tax=Gigaspora rosea TaxID=44941 RepID=A0A397VKM5_9GLOM|nr:hypothetical protein C2G38_2033074 [Gigaspora rosea]
MVPISKTIDIPPEERINSNMTKSFADNVDNFGAIGLLSFVKSDGTTDYCTATMIKTDNGNIALTAAHCLWDILSNQPLKWNSDIYFYPGKLQDDIGAFDVEFDIPGGDYPVTVFGYPGFGYMPNCPKDGEHLCSWQGNTFDFDQNLPNHELHRGIPIDVGGGSSGVLG